LAIISRNNGMRPFYSIVFASCNKIVFHKQPEKDVITMA
jgi:hypothetical protein